MENIQRKQLLRNGARLRKHNNCVSAGRNYDYKKGFMELRDPFVTEYFLKSFVIEAPRRNSTKCGKAPPKRDLTSGKLNDLGLDLRSCKYQSEMPLAISAGEKKNIPISSDHLKRHREEQYPMSHIGTVAET
ncbi:hypothetical protein J6590_073084 [Homalodisca vitripennis]|nr:hypothetical protein J6590_073084 [Homalodisca vitripennis]